MQDCWFVAGPAAPRDCSEAFQAVLVFAFYGDWIVLANIAGRGATTPSGHIEQGESPEQAAIRETYEETGGRIASGSLRRIGYHAYSPLTGERQGRVLYCPAYVAEIEQFDPLPAGSESLECLLVRPEDLAGRYFLWDDLARDLFEFAAEERAIQEIHE